MKIQMKRDLYDHYLVLSDQENEVLNSYQTRMLNENTIDGLLACHVEHIDDEIMLYYNVTSRQPLSELVSDRLISGKLLRLVLGSLLDALRGLGEFLLPPEGIILDPDYIFADSLLSEVRFCYFPGGAGEFSDAIRSLSEFLLPRLDHDDREAVMLGYSFYQSCMNDTLTEGGFARLLYGEETDPVEACEADTEDGTSSGRTARRSGASCEARAESSRKETSAAVERDDEIAAEKAFQRQQLLDDFFSDEDTEEEDPEAVKTRRFYVITAVLASAAAVLLILAGERDTGVGVGILIFAGMILVRKLRKKIGGEDERVEAVGEQASGRKEQEYFFSKEKETGPAGDGVPEEEAEEPVRMPDYLVRHYSSMMAYGEKSSDRGRGKRPDLRESSGCEERTGELSGSGETVLLSDFAGRTGKIRARLISLDDRGEAPHILTADEYRIGKSEFASDIVLHSEAVSRLHARLIWKGDHYALRDMRSKNATFINETMIDAGTDVALKDGDCCRFADRVYRYRTGGGPAA